MLSDHLPEVSLHCRPALLEGFGESSSTPIGSLVVDDVNDHSQAGSARIKRIAPNKSQ